VIGPSGGRGRRDQLPLAARTHRLAAATFHPTLHDSGPWASVAADADVSYIVAVASLRWQS
jgi:hypothetical protein